MGKCLDDLRRNYNRGLNDEEISEIFAEAEQLYKMVQASKQASNQSAYAQQLAAQKAAREQISLVLKKRNTFLQLSRKVEALENVLGNWQGREAEGLQAMMVGGNKMRDGARLSVDSKRLAVKGEYIGGFFNDVAALGKAYVAILKKGVMDREIAIAMDTIGNPRATPYSGPKEAMDIAKIAHKWQEKARLDQNRVGGFIMPDPGYIVRQSHDMDKIGAAGFEKWKGDIENRLDWSRTADGRFDSAKNPGWTLAERDAFLEQVYRNLSSGIHLKLAPDNPLSAGARVGSTAAQVSHERVLHFLDGEKWYEYNQLYGVGGVGDALIHGLGRAADKYALMSVFGPSPKANLENIIKALESSLNRRGDLNAARSFTSKIDRLRRHFEIIDGTANIPVRNMAMRVGRYVRAFQSMAKLGGAVISALSDTATFASEMSYQGKGFIRSLFRGALSAIRGRGTLDEKRILSSCGVFHDSLVGDLLSRFSAADAPGMMAKAMNFYFRINGLSLWTDSWKKAACLMMAHDFSWMAKLPFDGLKKQEQNLLRLYGIDEGQWDMWRKGKTVFADKREYLTPDAVFQIADNEIKAYLASKGMKATDLRVKNFREEFADRLRAMFQDRVRYAVIEPDARANALVTGGYRPGTVGGELMRYAMQFKSFPVAFLQRPFQRELFGRGADTVGGALKGAALGAAKTLLLQNGKGEFSQLGQLIAMTTVFGYFAMTIKQLLAGKNPRDPSEWQTWAAAAVQGGGLGIYGDFLFGQQSRSGGNLSGTLGGPAYSTAEEIASLYYKVRDGEDAGTQALRLFFNNIPGNNLFYLRCLMDYYIINPLFEKMNPGYMRRMEKRVLKNTGQTFWHDPGFKW